MDLLAAIAALISVLPAGIIYRTDAFRALVQRPALAELDDGTMATGALPKGHGNSQTASYPAQESGPREKRRA